MTRPTIVTSWSQAGEDLYGERFVKTWRRYWSAQTNLLIRTDRALLMDPEVVAFREREADEQTTSGCMKRGALKWSWKVFALTKKPLQESGWMIWIDGDVEFTAEPTPEFWAATCPPDADVSFLGRPWAYASETGFVAYNMDSPATHALLEDMRDTYLSGRFRGMTNWGDAAVFDKCREERLDEADNTVFDNCRDRTRLRENNLAAHLTGPEMHVWPDTVLASCMEHQKGPKRKKRAYGGAV